MNEKTLISKAMAILGSRKSKAKTKAARANAKFAGRPKGSKNKPKRNIDKKPTVR